MEEYSTRSELVKRNDELHVKAKEELGIGTSPDAAGGDQPNVIRAGET